MDRNLLRDLIHTHDILTLHVDLTRQAEISSQGTRQIVVLDMLCRADHCIHEDQEMVGAVMSLLVLQKKIHEGLLESDHGISSFFVIDQGWDGATNDVGAPDKQD